MAIQKTGRLQFTQKKVLIIIKIMDNKEIKQKRMEFLEATIRKYITTKPELSVEDIAVVICSEVCDENLLKFIKKYKKELKSC